MGSNYKKIQYEVEGSWGSTEYRTLYIKFNRSIDYTTIYDENFNEIFGFGEWGNFDMGEALTVVFNNWNDERMQQLSMEEIQKIHMKERPEKFKKLDL